MSDIDPENKDQVEAWFLQELEKVDLTWLEEAPYKGWAKTLEETLTHHRYHHVMGVVKTAIFLADRYGVNRVQAREAALLHDCAKKQEKPYFQKLKKRGVLTDEDWDPSPTYHAFLGSYVAQEIFGEEDPAVIQAIRQHTMGRVGMTPLDQVVFLADLLEPSRKFPGLAELRAYSLQGLDLATYKVMNHNLSYLLASNVYIEPESLLTRNWMLNVLKNKKRKQKSKRQDELND